MLKIFEERVKTAKSTGLDGVSAKALGKRIENEVQSASRKVRNGRYRFTRYKEKLILKDHRKPPRQIAIPTIRDTIVLRALCDYLTESYDECRMRPPHDTIKRISSAVKEAAPGDCFLRMDVINFYPSIVHEVLLSQLSQRICDAAAIELVEKAIKTPIGFGERAIRAVGVPQGLSISNILSMIYLRDFDLTCDLQYRYFRYVDDIVVLTPKQNVAQVHSEISKQLWEKLQLECHPLEEDGGKTEISTVDDGTDYLGYRISRGKLSIRERSYRKMFGAIIGCLRALKGTATSEQVLWKLNLVISGCRFEERSVGWVFFFRQSTDMSQLYRMDAFVAKKMGEYGLEHMKSRAKSFAKTYREIRYNRERTSYVPDFDSFTLASKIETVSLIRGISKGKLAQMERSEIDEIYWSMIRGQVAQMEKETVDFGSGSGGY